MNNNENKNFVYAKIPKRIGAYIIDLLVLAVILILELNICKNFKYLMSNEQHILLSDILGLINAIIYFSISESSKKQATIGKRAMGIIVTNLHGERLSVGKAFLRNIIKFIGSFIWILSSVKEMIIISFLGYILSIFLPKKQALHDLIAGSIVVNRK
jgi:uncharacterized RDD family membrane protein YckC